MALPTFAKDQARLIEELAARVAELEKKLAALPERKKPGPKPKSEANE